MARERVVTRNVQATEYTLDTYAPATRTIEVQTYTVTGDILKDEQVIRKAEKDLGVKVLAITDRKTTECIYGMTEVDFLKYARRMDADRHFIQ